MHSAPLGHDGSELRFRFGRNWKSFLETVDEERISSSEQALVAMLGEMRGKTFLDVGCGSGLSSLAAHRLGAVVEAFDFDLDSVECALELQRRFGGDWRVREGSALDAAFLRELGTFDIVYSWGVLHHTGAMWQALGNMVPLVKVGGTLFISIYNDQGRKSRMWRALKRLYNTSDLFKPFMIGIAFAVLRVPVMVLDMVRSASPFASIRSKHRGMSKWHDLIDWVGGYPFEVARPEEIFRFYRVRGFELLELKTCGGDLGCNEYVFRRKAVA